MGVIVTVVNGSDQQDWMDFELPSDIPITEVTLMLADVLTNGAVNEGQYILEVKTKTGVWRKLDETKSLDDCKIMDGAYLRLQEKHLAEDWHAVIADQMELLSKEKIKESLEAWRTDDQNDQGGEYQ